MPYEYTRVRDNETGHEYDVRRVNPDRHTVLEGYPPARGYARPAKHRTDKGGNPLTERSTRTEIDAYASGQGIDVTGAANKTEALALIEAASQTPPTGEGTTASDQAADTTE